MSSPLNASPGTKILQQFYDVYPWREVLLRRQAKPTTPSSLRKRTVVSVQDALSATERLAPVDFRDEHAESLQKYEVSKVAQSPGLVNSFMESMSPLCKLLNDQGYVFDESSAQVRSRLWVLRMFSDILELRKQVLIQTQSSRSAAALRAPAFVLYSAVAKVGAAPVAGQRCWEFYHGLQRYRQLDRTCELALLLFDEALDDTDFDFIASCRALLVGDVPEPADLSAIMIPSEKWFPVIQEFFESKTAISVVDKIRLLSTTTDATRPPMVPAIMFIALALSIYRSLSGRPALMVAGMSGDEQFFWHTMPAERKAEATWETLIAEACAEVADETHRDLGYETQFNAKTENLIAVQKAQIMDLRAEIEKQAAEIEKKDASLYKTEQRALADTTRRQDAEKEVALYKQKLQQEIEDGASNRASVQQLQQLVARRESEVAAAQAEITRSRDTATDAIMKAAEEIKRLQQANEQLRAQLAQVQTETQSSRADVAAANERIQVIKQQADAEIAQVKKDFALQQAALEQKHFSERASDPALIKLQEFQQQSRLELQALRDQHEKNLAAQQQLTAQDLLAAKDRVKILEVQNQKLQIELQQQQREVENSKSSLLSAASEKQAMHEFVVQLKTERQQAQRDAAEHAAIAARLQAKIAALEGNDMAEVDLQHTREQQELIASMQAKADALVAQHEIENSEKDALIEQLEQALAEAQAQKDSAVEQARGQIQGQAAQDKEHARLRLEEQYKATITTLREQNDRNEAHIKREERQHKETVAALNTQIESLKGDVAELRRQLQASEQALALEKADRADIEAQLQAFIEAQRRGRVGALILQDTPSRRRTSTEGSFSSRSGTPTDSMLKLDSRLSSVASPVSTHDDDDPASYLPNAKFDSVQEITGCEFVPSQDKDADDLFYTVHTTANSKQVYKSDVCKKSINPHWGEIRNVRSPDLISSDSFFVRVWAKRTFSKDVLVAQQQFEIKQLVPFNPFANAQAGQTNIILVTINSRVFQMPREALAGLIPTPRGRSESLQTASTDGAESPLPPDSSAAATVTGTAAVLPPSAAINIPSATAQVDSAAASPAPASISSSPALASPAVAAVVASGSPASVTTTMSPLFRRRKTSSSFALTSPPNIPQ